VVPATAASQNGFCSCKGSFHEKPNFIANMTKKQYIFFTVTFIFWSSLKRYHYTSGFWPRMRARAHAHPSF
jgi:hypothetical protein